MTDCVFCRRARLVLLVVASLAAIYGVLWLGR